LLAYSSGLKKNLRKTVVRILIVEDDPVLADGLQVSLRNAEYAVDWVADGAMADRLLKDEVYDVMILDLGLPKIDGFEVLKRLRARGSKLPVMILSARDGTDDRVRGLDLGADDYMVKPFSLPEMEARVRALLRRGMGATQSLLIHGSLAFDSASRMAAVDGKPLELSGREISVLEVLLLRAGRVVSKEQLVEHLYSFNEEVGMNAIEVYVHRLRKKIEGAGVTIRTVRGLGYLLDKAGLPEADV
jgi:two-component system, OmpR family, response regulator